MNLFNRLSNLLAAAPINAEARLDLLLADMETVLAKARRSVALAIAAERRLARARPDVPTEDLDESLALVRRSLRILERRVATVRQEQYTLVARHRAALALLELNGQGDTPRERLDRLEDEWRQFRKEMEAEIAAVRA